VKFKVAITSLLAAILAINATMAYMVITEEKKQTAGINQQTEEMKLQTEQLKLQTETLKLQVENIKQQIDISKAETKAIMILAEQQLEKAVIDNHLNPDSIDLYSTAMNAEVKINAIRKLAEEMGIDDYPYASINFYPIVPKALLPD